MPSLLGVCIVLAGAFLVVLVHELGHLIAARAMGIPVRRFQIGVPHRPGITWTRGETTYGIGLFPLMGYIYMGKDDKDDLDNYPLRARLWATLGGVIGNFALGFPLVVLSLLLGGHSLGSSIAQACMLLVRLLLLIPTISLAMITDPIPDAGSSWTLLGAGADGVFTLTVGQFAGVFGGLSLVLGVLQLIPLPPFDGGHILRHVIVHRWPRLDVVFTVVGLGMIVVLLLGMGISLLPPGWFN